MKKQAKKRRKRSKLPKKPLTNMPIPPQNTDSHDQTLTPPADYAVDLSEFMTQKPPSNSEIQPENAENDTPNRGPKPLECPRCGCKHFETITTRRHSDGHLYRRKQCRHCGRRITSIEIPLAEKNSMDNANL